jgi:uncharacterized protein YceH (UPF0502 family)
MRRGDARMLEQAHVTVINEVILACRNASSQYETIASLLEDPGIRNNVQALARAREKSAADLERGLRDRGSLPRELDPEKEGLKSLWTHLKAGLEENRAGLLLHKGVQLENEVIDRCERAFEHRLPEDVRHTLEELERNALNAKQWLETKAGP